jgi:hypothetical protein
MLIEEVDLDSALGGCVGENDQKFMALFEKLEINVIFTFHIWQMAITSHTDVNNFFHSVPICLLSTAIYI